MQTHANYQQTPSAVNHNCPWRVNLLPQWFWTVLDPSWQIRMEFYLQKWAQIQLLWLWLRTNTSISDNDLDVKLAPLGFACVVWGKYWLKGLSCSWAPLFLCVCHFGWDKSEQISKYTSRPCGLIQMSVKPPILPSHTLSTQSVNQHKYGNCIVKTSVLNQYLALLK